MTNIQLPDEFIHRIEAYVDAERGITMLDVLSRALDNYEVMHSAPMVTSTDLHTHFNPFRGMLAGLTREQMLADRREGLK